MRVSAGSGSAASGSRFGQKRNGRRAVLIASAAAMAWPSLGAGPALAGEPEAEGEMATADMVAVSLPAGVLDGALASEMSPYGQEPSLTAAGGEDKPLTAAGKAVKGPLAPAGPEQEFSAGFYAPEDGSDLLVGSTARKDADLLRDPSLSADHGAPDVRFAPEGPARPQSR
jgi:hypothetical protein